MKYSGKLLLSDMDGTLLDSNKQISDQNRAAIESFVRQGGHFSVATGRAVASVKPYAGDLPLRLPIVVSNGALIYDLERNEIIRLISLGEEAKGLVRELKARFPYLGIEVDTDLGDFVAQNNEYVTQHLRRVYIEIDEREIGDIPGRWYKINLLCAPELMPPVEAYVREQYGDSFAQAMTLPFFFELTHPTANKGNAALYLCAHLGVDPEHLYVAGDEANDLVMMGVTRNAYAPRNASREIRAAARHLLPSCDESAIAALIDSI